MLKSYSLPLPPKLSLTGIMYPAILLAKYIGESSSEEIDNTKKKLSNVRMTTIIYLVASSCFYFSIFFLKQRLYTVAYYASSSFTAASVQEA